MFQLNINKDMKKILLFVVSMLISVIVFCQESTKITETERIVDKYADKFGDAIKQMAVALKTPVEHVYEVLVRQQVVNSFISIGYLVLLVICAVLIWKCYIKGNEMYSESGDDCFVVIAVIASVLWGVFVIVFFASGSFGDIFQGFVNPEYGAIRDIMELINPAPISNC